MKVIQMSLDCAESKRHFKSTETVSLPVNSYTFIVFRSCLRKPLKAQRQRWRSKETIPVSSTTDLCEIKGHAIWEILTKSNHDPERKENERKRKRAWILAAPLQQAAGAQPYFTLSIQIVVLMSPPYPPLFLPLTKGPFSSPSSFSSSPLHFCMNTSVMENLNSGKQLWDTEEAGHWGSPKKEKPQVKSCDTSEGDYDHGGCEGLKMRVWLDSTTNYFNQLSHWHQTLIDSWKQNKNN